eukprot:3940917-Rhodomonas_salina.3
MSGSTIRYLSTAHRIARPQAGSLYTGRSHAQARQIAPGLDTLCQYRTSHSMRTDHTQHQDRMSRTASSIRDVNTGHRIARATGHRVARAKADSTECVLSVPDTCVGRYQLDVMSVADTAQAGQHHTPCLYGIPRRHQSDTREVCTRKGSIICHLCTGQHVGSRTSDALSVPNAA